ncbi:MAG: TerB family tellurite resistance protein [Pseudomonadota bacterium]
MHIIMGIILAAGAIAFAVSRIIQAGDDVRGAARRYKWSRRTNTSPLDGLSDPREAGAVLVTQVAAYEGDLTEAQAAAIRDGMAERFGVSGDEATELLGFGRHAVGQLTDAANSLSKLVSPIRAACTDEESAGFVQLLQTVAAVEGPVTDEQQRLIDGVRRGLLN